MTTRPNPKKKRIKLTGKAYTEFRRKVGERASFHCEKCGVHAPRLWYEKFNLYHCGHVCHKKSRGAGGDDTMDNVWWGCFDCHTAERSWKSK